MERTEVLKKIQAFENSGNRKASGETIGQLRGQKIISN